MCGLLLSPYGLADTGVDDAGKTGHLIAQEVVPTGEGDQAALARGQGRPFGDIVGCHLVVVLGLDCDA